MVDIDVILSLLQKVPFFFTKISKKSSAESGPSNLDFAARSIAKRMFHKNSHCRNFDWTDHALNVESDV